MTPSHALILAAGLGTRLRPLTNGRAKPALPVGGEPLIRRILRWLAGHDVTDVVVNLHHQPASLTAIVGDGSDLGVRVRYSWEQPRVLGSAGGPRKALPLVEAERFFLINGDTLTDVDLGGLADAHARSGALVTLAVVPNRDYLRYGGVRVDAAGAVTGFSGKGNESKDSWHFVGVQVVERSVFADLPADEPASTIGGIYDELIRTRPGAVSALRGDLPFWDIGTAADYFRMSQTLSAGGVEIGARTAVDPGARISESILWDDVEIGAGVSLHRCIVADGVRLPAGSYQGAILTARDGVVAVTPFDV